MEHCRLVKILVRYDYWSRECFGEPSTGLRRRREKYFWVEAEAIFSINGDADSSRWKVGEKRYEAVSKKSFAQFLIFFLISKNPFSKMMRTASCRLAEYRLIDFHLFSICTIILSTNRCLPRFFLKNWAITGLFFIYFGLFNTVW